VNLKVVNEAATHENVGLKGVNEFAISVKVKLKGVNEASKGPKRGNVSLKGPSTVKYVERSR